MSIWKSEIRSRKSDLDEHKGFTLGILAALLVTAFALRLYGLDSQLWYDEMLTYNKYMHLPVENLISVYYSNNNHILYTLIAHASFWIFGESAWALRLPAVIFGIGSIWALFLLGRYISTAREGLFSAALLALSYQHIWFSQNARGYTALLFFTIAASLLFVRGIRETRSDLWILYAFVSALGAYTHMIMILVVLGHFIIYLLMLISRRKDYWPKRLYALFFGFCLAGFLTFQLYSLMLPQITNIFTPLLKLEHVRVVAEKSSLHELQKSEPMEWDNLFWTIKEFAKGIELSFTSSTLAVAVCVIFGVVFVAGLLRLRRKDPVIILLLIVPALIVSTVMIASGFPLFPRFFFFTFGLLIFIVVQGTTEVGEIMAKNMSAKHAKSILIGSVLCIILIFASAISIPSVYAYKQDFLGALTYVKDKSEPGDEIVTVDLTRVPYEQFYKVDWKAVNNVEELNSIRSQAKRTWLLYTFPVKLKTKHPKIMASIKRDFKVMKQFPGTLNGGTIIVCRSDTPSSSDKIYSTNVHVTPSTPRYGIFNLTFKHSGIYKNNFFDVAINVIFTSPSGIQYDIRGFYYRDDLWKVRFSPDEVGRWTYEYVMTGEGGFRKEGDGFFECTISDHEGVIRRHPVNPYRFVFSSGKPYYPVGLQNCIYTEGSKLKDITIDRIKLVDKVKRVSMITKGRQVSVNEYFYIYGQAGFNLFRFSQRNCSYSLYDNLDSFSEDKSMATDRLLFLARKNGFRVMFGFFGFHGKWPHGKKEEAIMSPDDHDTVAKEKRFINYCIARWGVYVDFWELLNERNATEKWTSMMADHVRAVDPYDKPISTSWARLYFHLPVIDLTSPHWYGGESRFQSDRRVQQWATLWKQPGKPVIVGEQGNRGASWGPYSSERMRIRTWTALFQEISFIFWNTGIWYTRDIAANLYLGPEEREYIRVLQDFSSKLDAEVRMTPAEVSSNGVRAYGLLSNTIAAVYLHHFENHNTLKNNVKITLDLPSSGHSGDELMGKWIDPATGEVLASIHVSTGHQTLHVPPFTVDIALIATSRSN
jgi:4-amino-4-deoxy-L-arabinose transferase-like glycosyltransferase